MKSIIKVNNVTLKFKMIQSASLKKMILSRMNTDRPIRKREKIALNQISFNLIQGETLGVIGGNGAGKSTLLRLLSGVYSPDDGELLKRTESIALLSLGTGFINELSGYENIYLNGLLLGFRKNQIDLIIEEIIEFSGISESIHDPVKTYSSGMKTRLAFSIASQVNPEILLIDEILGVGDIDFKNKSTRKIRSMIDQGRTVVVVSHNINTLREICDRVMWMEAGTIKMIGDTESVLDAYISGRA